MKRSTSFSAVSSAFAIAGVLAFSGQALADQVTATWNGGLANFRGVTFTVPGKGLTNTTAGLFEFVNETGADLVPQNDNTFVAFCVDLQEYIANGQTHTWDIRSVSEVPIPAGPPNPPDGMGALKATDLALLLGSNIGSSLATAKGWSNNERAAMQLAVWEIVYETHPTAGYALDTGNALFTDRSGNGLVTLANSYLSNLSGTAMQGLVGLANDDNIPNAGYTQDYIAQLVPIPAAAWLFGSALVGVVALGRRKNRADGASPTIAA